MSKQQYNVYSIMKGLAVIWHHCNFDFAYYLRMKVSLL
jgi:hypothetical protein